MSGDLRSLEAGRKLASPAVGDEVVISGMAGRFPNSDNVEEFKENLMNKMDLCDEDERRWVHTRDDIPKLSGKINHLDKLDIGAFGVHRLQADYMDPLVRLSIEKAYEAIIDAGINPEDLKGSNVGVFVGSCFSEMERRVCFDKLTSQGYGIAGCTRSMVAKRISYALQLNGPSMVCDSACSSGMYAFNQAYRAIREGKCEMALAGGINLVLNRYLTLQFARLGVLNMNTGCRPFDADASGYTRSEAIAMVLLQKKRGAKRIYAEVVHCNANVDGYKVQGITYPSGDAQAMLLEDVYEECGIPPETLAYVEAHGTGTRVGDPEELNAIDKVFCSKRKEPLLVGSIKGNIGHTEAASGTCGIIKVIFAMETGFISPNIHYDCPRKDVKGLETGRLKVLTEKTPWPSISPFAALNAFGFGGANCHVLLKRPDGSKTRPDDGQPRLVCFSGRTQESMESYKQFFKTKKLDYDAVSLFHSVFSKRITNDIYRGFSLVNSCGEIYSSSSYSPMQPKAVHLFLNGARQYHVELIKEMEKFKFFSNLIDKFKDTLKRNQISTDIYELKENAVFATVCLHYCVINTFKKLKVAFHGISSSSLGEFTAAYAAGFLTIDEAIQSVQIVASMLTKNNKLEKDLPKQLMQQLRKVLPKKLAKTRIVRTPKSSNFEYGSAEYFVRNILNPSVADESAWDNGCLVIGADFEKQEKPFKVFPLVQNGMKMKDILIKLGNLYELGIEGDFSQLYGKIEWPVRRGTPNISSLIRWNHDFNFVVLRNMNAKVIDPQKSSFFSILNSDSMFYKGHVIDGRNLFPATGYLYLVWDFYADLKRVLLQNMKVCFENVRFHRATTIGKDGSVKLYYTIHKSGDFEVSEGDTTVVTGRIYEVDETNIEYQGKPNDRSKPVLKHQDIYKELRLRGYNYKGPFKAIQEMHGENALIEWTGNWITYLDNMLQLFIIQDDTRSLYVPTGLDRLVIDATGHMEQVEALDENKVFPVEMALNRKIARSKYIEIRGMKAAAIMRKKLTYEPVLESHKFVPNITRLSAEASIRLNTHIVLENKPTITVKVLEVLAENSSNLQPISEHILKTLADLPLIQPDVSIYATRDLEAITGVHIINAFPEQKSLIYIGSHLLNDPKRMEEAKSKILDDGFIISIDAADHSAPEGVTILTTHKLPNGEFMHLLKETQPYQEPTCVNISQNFDDWLPVLQRHLKSSKKILLYSENDATSGLLGLVNCLRHEPATQKISCVFVQEGSGFDHSNDFFKKQLEKGLAVNVLRGETWGTYRHLLLEQCPKLDYRKCGHYFGNVLTIGDLSSWRFMKGPFDEEQILKQQDVAEVYYSAINFRDVMTASGKVPIDAITKNRIEQERVHGFEYSGKKQNGERVMGIVIGGAIANMVKCHEFMTWTVPDAWTLEEAATVPVVYLTAIVAMKTRGNVKRGDSVLINSGTGGVGQAAINCAHHWGCEIFVTVGTKEKKEFLLKNYPFLKESHIGNSRDIAFEQMISNKTGGRGVNLVLNSLAEDKLAASVRCLAPGGIFLEIGKFDLANNNGLAMDLAAKGCAFHGIMLDKMFDTSNGSTRLLYHILADAMDAGFIKPLGRTVFEKTHLEESFRYMASGKHMGKVILKIKDEFIAPDKNEDKHIVIPRFYCSQNGSYIILGGLGGFGLELADWLVLRGVKTLILSSRSGVQTGYQQYRIQFWQSNGVKVLIALDDISTYEGCESLMRKAEAIAPVHGIFNLAVVLKDSIFENQTVESFKISMCPKATATAHFDTLTRRSKTLKHFVVFSSFSCGRGNAGQTNYGMSNSIMERICELRRKDGFPALAIQWGAVGDVGIVAEMQKDQSEIAIGGTLQQRISSCLEVMDDFLYQDEAVLSSIVVAEKNRTGNSDNLIDAIMDIVGLRNLNSVSLHSTISELGMDSMMAVEVKQLLETDYDIFLSASDIRNLTFAKLMELNDTKNAGGEINESSLHESFGVLINQMYDMERYFEPFISYKNGLEDDDPIVVFPGIEGSYLGMIAINSNLDKSSICVQYTSESDIHGFDVLVDKVMNRLGDRLSKLDTFNFVAHSFGGPVALAIASRLERMGKTGKIVLIDTSPELIHRLYVLLNAPNDSELETILILMILSHYTPVDSFKELREHLSKTKSLNERLVIACQACEGIIDVPKEMVVNIIVLIINLVKSIVTFGPSEDKLKSQVVLCKPSFAAIRNIAEDYSLGTICENPVKILNFDGDHRTILDNANLIKEINIILK